MSKLKKVLLAVCLFVFFFVVAPAKKAEADVQQACNSIYDGYTLRTSFSDGQWPGSVQGLVDYMATLGGSLQINIDRLVPSKNYIFRCWVDVPGLGGIGDYTLFEKSFSSNSDGTAVITLNDNKCFQTPAGGAEGDGSQLFSRANIEIEQNGLKCSSNNYTIYDQASGASCESFGVTNQRVSPNLTCFQPNDVLNWQFKLKDGNNIPIKVLIASPDQTSEASVDTTADATGQGAGTITLGGNGTVGKELFLYIRDKRSNLNICQKSIGTKKALCSDVPPIETPDPEANAAFSLCQQIPVTPNNGVTNLDQKGQECCLCATGNSGRDSKTGLCTTSSTDPTFVPGIWTAIGCIKADQESIVTTLLRVGIGLAGGVALIMILVAAFALSTSQGEPKRANEAREMLTSAIIGLLFIIFSVTILQFIGVTILRIPNFGP